MGSDQSLWALDPCVAACCSDDETDEEETANSGSKVCKVRQLKWRSSAMGRVLDKLDEFRDKKSAGSIRTSPGNTPRLRVRGEDNPENSSKAPKRLPRDVYDDEWYDDLEDSEREELEELPRVGLSHYIRVLNNLC